MLRRIRALVLVGAMLLLALPGAVVAETHNVNQECRSFDVTGFALCGVFLDFWETNGGLPVFGYPLTDAHPEQNYDTGTTYTVQYFERQRFEHHPENAGSIYEVLLGRLGAQILELQGRNWHAFPKASPTAPHYVPETGHAVAEVFWSYYTSHGLDLGDPGTSWRESVMLFGYPISPATMETNEDGDTVLTQWFERAVFEHHPQNPAPYDILLRRVGAELLDWMTEPEPGPDQELVTDVMASGLTNPRGMFVAANGDLYITEAGAGGNMCRDVELGIGQAQACFGYTGAVLRRAADGHLSVVVSGLPSYRAGDDVTGPHDVYLDDDGTLWVLMGLGANPAERANFPLGGNTFGHLLRVNADRTWESVVDVAAYEAAVNPDGTTVDSNPFAMAVTDWGIAVTDAGGNALLWIDQELKLSHLTVFAPIMMTAPPFLGLPEGTQIPADAVPTGVVAGADGALYVTLLTGFPFEVGKASVWRVTTSGEATEYAAGFTNLMDLDFDNQGRLVVVELTKTGYLAVDQNAPATLRGRVTRIAANGARTVLVDEGLVLPTSIATGTDGSLFVTSFGVMPELGMVLRLSWQ
jgi:hypothetical protein